MIVSSPQPEAVELTPWPYTKFLTDPGNEGGDENAYYARQRAAQNPQSESARSRATAANYQENVDDVVPSQLRNAPGVKTSGGSKDKYGRPTISYDGQTYVLGRNPNDSDLKVKDDLSSRTDYGVSIDGGKYTDYYLRIRDTVPGAQTQPDFIRFRVYNQNGRIIDSSLSDVYSPDRVNNVKNDSPLSVRQAEDKYVDKIVSNATSKFNRGQATNVVADLTNVNTELGPEAASRVASRVTTRLADDPVTLSFYRMNGYDPVGGPFEGGFYRSGAEGETVARGGFGALNFSRNIVEPAPPEGGFVDPPGRDSGGRLPP